ncbi:MAG: SH3 domain-containing protein [Candidatus Promineifilaceae bacterium]
MKRLTVFPGLFLVSFIFLSSLWASMARAGAAADDDQQIADRLGQEAAQPAAGTPVVVAPVVVAPAVESVQIATISVSEFADAAVNFDDLNMRGGPGLGFDILGNYAKGTLLTVLGQAHDSDAMPWLHVRTPDGKTGWMSARPSLQSTKFLQVYIPLSSIPFETPAEPTPFPADGFVDVDALNMRSGPGLEYGMVGRYVQDTPFEILGQSADSDNMPWLYVQTPDGNEGYFSSRPSLSDTEYLQINAAQSDIPPVVESPIVESADIFWLDNMHTVSCDNVCATEIAIQTEFSGNEVCLEWHENGAPYFQQSILVDILHNGTFSGQASVAARGDNFCRPLKIVLQQAGDYEAVISTFYGEYKPIAWTVD